MNYQGLCYITWIFGFLLSVEAKGDVKVVYAINAGSHEHVDQNGIHYLADTLRVGTASDYGNVLIMIGRVPEKDEILYRTERYHTSTFGYDLPIDGDGEYALVLKFCEVYFSEPNMKVFDVVLNKQHTVVSQLDIFHEVGRGTAHDEYVYFAVDNGRLFFKDEESKIYNNIIRLEFIKGEHDNPKINAFALLKGDVESIPRLLSNSEDTFTDERVVQDESSQEQIVNEENEIKSKTENIIEDSEEQEEQPTRLRKTSGPRKPSPYIVEDSSSIMLPVFIAVGAFIPLLFCLCKV